MDWPTNFMVVNPVLRSEERVDFEWAKEIVCVGLVERVPQVEPPAAQCVRPDDECGDDERTPGRAGRCFAGRVKRARMYQECTDVFNGLYER